MQIKELVTKAHNNAINKGFWEDWDLISFYARTFTTRDVGKGNVFENVLISKNLMLIVGELAEAQEALRKNDRANFEEELADVVIRLADLCGGLDIDLEAEIIKKMEKNKDRPYKHGKAF